MLPQDLAVVLVACVSTLADIVAIVGVIIVVGVVIVLAQPPRPKGPDPMFRMLVRARAGGQESPQQPCVNSGGPDVSGFVRIAEKHAGCP